MDNWKTLFDSRVVEMGELYYVGGRVVDFEETEKGCSAGVLMRRRYDVRIRIDRDQVVWMRCQCPVSKGGRNCEHMAAVLAAAEAGKRAAELNIDESDMRQIMQKEIALRNAEEQKKKEAQVRKGRKSAADRVDQKRQKEKLPEEQKRQQEILQEEEKRKKEQLQQEQKQREEEIRLEAAREEKRKAREVRKAEKAKKEEARRQKLAEERRIEREKQLAEEARREEIRRKKAEEAERREKKRLEEERGKELARKKRQEEERLKKEEERKKKEERRKKKEAERQKKEREARQKEEKQQRREEMMGQKQNEERKTSLQNTGEAEDYILVSDPAEETDEEAGRIAYEKLSAYHYFDGTAIRKSVDLDKGALREGRRLHKQEAVGIVHVESFYYPARGETCVRADTVVSDGGNRYEVEIVAARNRVIGWSCTCPDCRWRSNYWFDPKSDCKYKAAALYELEPFINANNMGDATDMNAHRLLFACRGVANRGADVHTGEAPLTLEPKLTKKDGELSVSFRVGEKRLFVVKKLDEFVSLVKNSETTVYGKDTQIHHDRNRFSETGRRWFAFITKIVQEEERIKERLENRMSRSRYSYLQPNVAGPGSSLKLYGWRLDDFYGLMQKETIDFEDKDAGMKKRGITAGEEDPVIRMQIAPLYYENSPEIHGISVSGQFPELYQGTERAYYIRENLFCRTSAEFAGKTEEFSQISQDGTFAFSVGRNKLSEFYHHVLPQLEGMLEITGKDTEKLQALIPPDVRFGFYLDASGKTMSCRIAAIYGDAFFSALDALDEGKRVSMALQRNRDREEEIAELVRAWFPVINEEENQLENEKEDEIYRFLETGIETLSAIGEVRATKKFLQIQRIRPVKVNVGVSVSEGMLDLDIQTDDVSRKELLDILQSYRQKKKYYRLKDGAFVNMQEPSLEMLVELMEAMQLKNRDFLKEKIHLPVYRTLYLDHLLEQNEALYSERDAHFKKLIKEFKTIRDADFEVPESLAKIMRGYQKNGYRWMRTIESWRFGGILADDMGLGKTLQMISVILAAKQEGKSGTSLVVSPASLVYNWGEEFKKFAPELSVQTVTGTKKEREELLASCTDVDVLVTSYDLLKRDIDLYEDRTFLYEVIDEAQYIKNHTTAAAKAVKVIRSTCRFALTGTPIENRLSELWSIFDFLMPGFLYGYETFRKEFELPIAKDRDEEAMSRLQKMVSPFILRRLKEQVLKDLPEKLEETRFVRLSGEQRRLYDAQVLQIKETLGRQSASEFKKNKMVILAALTKLRQICCDPELCFENYTGETAKTEACIELILSAIDGDHRMLVFSQFTSMLDILKSRLEKEGIDYYVITGSTSKEERLRLVKAFNTGTVPVFLISLKAGGVGLNLTGADVVIHYDPWWNVAAQNQATDRTHRIGQTKRVTEFKLIAQDTIEEKIRKLQETKQDLADQIVNTETGQIGQMTKEDLLELL